MKSHGMYCWKCKKRIRSNKVKQHLDKHLKKEEIE